MIYTALVIYFNDLADKSFLWADNFTDLFWTLDVTRNL